MFSLPEGDACGLLTQVKLFGLPGSGWTMPISMKNLPLGISPLRLGVCFSVIAALYCVVEFMLSLFKGMVVGDQLLSSLVPVTAAVVALSISSKLQLCVDEFSSTDQQ
jgi:hypothetical protein